MREGIKLKFILIQSQCVDVIRKGTASETVQSEWGLCCCSFTILSPQEGYSSKGPMTSSAMKRMISKFKATGCLADRAQVLMLLGHFRKKWRLQHIRLRIGQSALVKSQVALAFHALLFGQYYYVPFYTILKVFSVMVSCCPVIL